MKPFNEIFSDVACEGKTQQALIRDFCREMYNAFKEDLERQDRRISGLERYVLVTKPTTDQFPRGPLK